MAHALSAKPVLKPVSDAAAAVSFYLRSVWERGPSPHWSEYLHDKR